MEFELSQEQRALQETARRFSEAELPDVAKLMEKNNEPVGSEIIRRFAEMGFLGVNLPEAYGGAGAKHLDAVLVLEEIAKISIAVAFPIFES